MKVGVGIISWNRPQYLEQLIKSLEKNDLSNVDFHLFQDGAECKFTKKIVASTEDINKSISLFAEASFPYKDYHIQDKNVSVAINQFEAMQYLYNNYNYFIFLEDDVIVSPNFIALAKKLLKQFESDERVACISPGLRLLCKPEKVKENLDKLTFKRGHFWAEMCWSEKWKEIEKQYMAYYDIVKGSPYRKRDNGRIKALFGSSGHQMITTSQDNGKDWAILMTKMRRARMVVNRATGIGDYGIHSTPAKLKSTGDGHNKIYAFEEELSIEEFKIV